MKKLLLMKLALALFVVIPVSSWAADSEKKIELKQLVPGKYEMVNKVLMDQQQQLTAFVDGKRQEDGDGTVNGKNTQEQFFLVTIESPSSDGTWKEIFEVTRIKLAINQQVQMADEPKQDIEVSFDSADPIDPAQPNPLAASGGILVGLKLTVTYNSNREPIKIEGLESFFGKIVEESPESAPMIQMMMQSMSSEQLTKQWNTSRNGLPMRPVAVGETWEIATPSPIPLFGSTDILSTYTLKSVEIADGIELAQLESVVQVKSDDPQTMKQMEIPVNMEQMTMDIVMTTKMEVATGCPVESVGKINMAAKMEIEIPQEVEGQQVLMKTDMIITGTVSTTMKRID